MHIFSCVVILMLSYKQGDIFIKMVENLQYYMFKLNGHLWHNLDKPKPT